MLMVLQWMLGFSMQDAVRRLNARLAGSHAGDPQDLHSRVGVQPYSQHGHAERGTRQRCRSWERPNGIRGTHAPASRSDPSGPDEKLDPLQASEGVYDRLDDKDRRQSMYDKVNVHLAGDVGNVSGKVKIIGNDIVQHNQCIGIVNLKWGVFARRRTTIFSPKLTV